MKRAHGKCGEGQSEKNVKGRGSKAKGLLSGHDIPLQAWIYRVASKRGPVYSLKEAGYPNHTVSRRTSGYLSPMRIPIRLQADQKMNRRWVHCALR